MGSMDFSETTIHKAIRLQNDNTGQISAWSLSVVVTSHAVVDPLANAA